MSDVKSVEANDNQKLY